MIISVSTFCNSEHEQKREWELTFIFLLMYDRDIVLLKYAELFYVLLPLYVSVAAYCFVHRVDSHIKLLMPPT